MLQIPLMNKQTGEHNGGSIAYDGRNQEDVYKRQVQMRYDESLSCAMEEIPVTDARMIQNFPGSLWRITLTSPPAVNVKQAFRFVPDT